MEVEKLYKQKDTRQVFYYNKGAIVHTGGESWYIIESGKQQNN